MSDDESFCSSSSFYDFCGICYKSINEFPGQNESSVKIECHKDCIDIDSLNTFKKINYLNKNIDLDTFYEYKNGETKLSEKDKKIIKYAFKLKESSDIIYDIFYMSFL